VVCLGPVGTREDLYGATSQWEQMADLLWMRQR